MLVQLADWCYRQRRLVLILWVAALAGAFALSASFGGETKQDYFQPGSESRAASETLSTSPKAAWRLRSQSFHGCQEMGARAE